MAIFFSCSCGQSLRAEEQQAGSCTRCPACGEFVQAPSLHGANLAVGIDSLPIFEPAAPALLVPSLALLELKAVEIPLASSATLSPTGPSMRDQAVVDVYRLAGSDGGEAAAMRTAEEWQLVRKALDEGKKRLAERRQRRSWQLEKRCCEYLFYPVRALPFLAALGLAWVILLSILAANWPAEWGATDTVSFAALWFFAFLLLGYTCACLDATLACANAGQAGYIAWAERGPTLVLRSGAQCVGCFLAGPVVLVAMAFWFWLHSGDFEVVDWLIVLELVLVAVAYHVLSLWVVQESGKVYYANPWAVIKFVRSTGGRALPAALLVAVIVVGSGFATVAAVAESENVLSTWFWLLWLWTGQLFLIVLVLRWFGVSRFYGRVSGGKSQKAKAQV